MGISEFIVSYGSLVMVVMSVVLTQGYTTDRVIDTTPMTIRVVTGTVALLPCRVDPKYTEKQSDDYKVVWVSPTKTAISLQDRRIINDQRISVERPFLKDWNLHIRNVSLTDAGVYKCQINTDPVGTKNITLIVQDPPHIIDYSMPLDVQSEEMGKVELFCNASGFPEPNITWFRLHKETHGVKEKVGTIGNSLVIRNISRMCADSYMCVANNGVPPAMSRTFQVTVLYPPEVFLPNTRLGQEVGKDTVLECEVTASPLAIVVWKFRNRTLMNNNFKHELNLYNRDPEGAIILSLRILKVKSRDFGKYECEAKNNLGIKQGFMELYEIKKKPKTTTTTTTTERYTWRSEAQNKKVDIYRGRGNGRGNTNNGKGRNQGLIWDRQGNNGESSYNSGEDASSSGNGHGGHGGRSGTRGQTKYSGMQSGNAGGQGSNLRDGSGSATTLMTSVLLLLISVVFNYAATYAIFR